MVVLSVMGGLLASYLNENWVVPPTVCKPWSVNLTFVSVTVCPNACIETFLPKLPSALSLPVAGSMVRVRFWETLAVIGLLAAAGAGAPAIGGVAEAARPP